MKVFVKSILFLLCIVIYAGTASFGQAAYKNPHKFSKQDWELKKPCNPCHIYFKQFDTDTVNTFSISYSNERETPADSFYVSGVTKLCISCHDGMVASLDEGTANFSQLLTTGKIIKHNHPVSVKYPVDWRSRRKFNDPDTTRSGLGGTISEDLLVNGRVECISCHDAHFLMPPDPCDGCPPETDQYKASIGNRSLWISNKWSALCLTCHKK